jgi:hypothetical protein
MSKEKIDIIATIRDCELEKFVAATHSRYGVVWLLERCNKKNIFVISYCSDKGEFSAGLSRKLVEISEEELIIGEDRKLPEAVKDKLLESNKMLSDFQFYVCKSIEKEGRMLGIVAFDGDKEHQSEEKINLYIELLSYSIEYARDFRISDAICSVQQLTLNKKQNVKELLSNVRKDVKKRINAKFLLYKDSKDDMWKDESGNEYDLDIKDGNKEERINIHIGEEEYKAIYVPIYQTALDLKETDFLKKNDFISKHRSCDFVCSHVLFYQKDSKLYLNNIFSEADLKTCKVVFNFIKQVISSKLIIENFDEISELSDKTYDKADRDRGRNEECDDLLNELKKISSVFTKTKVYPIEYNEDDHKVYFSSRDNETLSENEEYLRNKISDLYKKNEKEFDQIHVCFRVFEEKKFLYVFIKESNLLARLYSLEVSSKQVPYVALITVMSFFSEACLYYRRKADWQERVYHLMETRHVTTHYISSISGNIRSLEKLINSRRGDPYRWGHLLKQKHFFKRLGRATGAITQLKMLMENGRFLINKIRPEALDKKPLRIFEVVLEAVRDLNLMIERRNIRVVSYVSGNPPSIMNGDKTILKIAILNIIDNAIKYSPTYGEVWWSIEYKNGCYEFKVMNLGEKIDDRCFRIGYRGKQKDHLNPVHGTGLGLPVAKECILAHSENASFICDHEKTSDLNGPMNVVGFRMPYLTGQSRKGASSGAEED